MPRPVAVRTVTPGDAAAVRAVLGRDVEAALGGVLAADLARPAVDSAAWLAGDAYARVARGPRDGTWLVAVHGGGAATRAALLDAAADHAARGGGGRLTWWVPDATDVDHEAARAADFRFVRGQHQMRAALPLAPAATAIEWPAGVVLRPFDARRDTDAWLALNNAAFADHPEQGGWTRAILEDRRREPWFDPALFLVAAEDERGALAGFNWLKVHREAPAPAGEIYAIAVAPALQGRGLGRALVVAGLQRLAEHGLHTALLYVAADNAAALTLYRGLGFVSHRVDFAYERVVAP